MKTDKRSTHPQQPSQWVVKHCSQIKSGGRVLDLACGSGRHTRYLLSQGFNLTAVDRDISKIEDLCCQKIETDLENDKPWPLQEKFDGIVVTNYLYRPAFDLLINNLAEDGVLIYQTFMMGNEAFGKPGNPDFLLQENELKQRFKSLSIIAFSQGEVTHPRPAVTQQICARKIAI